MKGNPEREELTGDEMRRQIEAVLALGDMGSAVTGFPEELLSSLLHGVPQDAPEQQSANPQVVLDNPGESHT